MSTPHLDPDLPYWLAWTFVVGDKRQFRLYEHFGSMAAAWHASLAELAAVLGADAAPVWVKRQQLDAMACWRQVDLESHTILTWHMLAYPACLRELSDPPPVLYVRGVLPALSHAVAIVGAREARDYGRRVARRLGRDLASLGAVVVSGVAAGIDTEAHYGALEAPGGLTIGVLGCGLGVHYPYGPEHRRLYDRIAGRGALVTECPPMARPLAHHFPRRNRLIAALSRGVVVVEATPKSGSLITVGCATDLGKPVMAVPGEIDAPESSGTLALLRDGARMVTSVKDVLEELALTARPIAPPPPTDPTEAHLYTLLARGPSSLDHLLAVSGLASGVALAALLRLELAGRIRKQPGPRFCLP